VKTVLRARDLRGAAARKPPLSQARFQTPWVRCAPGITGFGAMHAYSRELSRLRCG